MSPLARRHRALSSALLAVALCGFARAQGSCAPWAETPTPFDPSWDGGAVLEDISAVHPDLAWAVGRRHVTTSGMFETLTLAMVWDGTSWTQVPTPSPTLYPGGTNARLYAVAALSQDDVWAGGAAVGDAGGASVGDWVLVEHFDGTSWQVVPPPPPPGGISVNFSGTRIRDIVAFSSNDVWFGGFWANPNANFGVDWRPLAMHWNGSGLTVFPTPVIYSGGDGFGIVSMSALAPNDIWAACARNSSSGASNLNVILHYDGSSWTQLPVPATTAVPATLASHTLREIVALAPNDVWVFGDYYYPSAPFALHYDGSTWTHVTGAPYASSAVALGPGAIYCGTDVVTLYDGSTANVVETFPSTSYPSILSMDRSAWCGIWAAGRKFVNGQPRPFAAQMGGGISTAAAVPRVGCAYPAPLSSLYASAPPLLGQTLVLAVGDPTNAAMLTPGTTQTYLAFALAAATTGPCGLVVPGFGIGTAPGELLINPTPASLVAILGPSPWNGTGAPGIHTIGVPGDPFLAGLHAHAQGALIDGTGDTVLTNALELVIGY